VTPHVLKAVDDGKKWVPVPVPPPQSTVTMKPETVKALHDGLWLVVNGAWTGGRARIEGHDVSGKTGTAQVPERGGYASGKYISSFIGFFPADNPEVCISVLLEEPDMRKGYYGGQTAAPYFKSVAETVANYLKIRPDKDDMLANKGGTNTLNTASLLP